MPLKAANHGRSFRPRGLLRSASASNLYADGLGLEKGGGVASETVRVSAPGRTKGKWAGQGRERFLSEAWQWVGGALWAGPAQSVASEAFPAGWEKSSLEKLAAGLGRGGGGRGPAFHEQRRRRPGT